MKKTIVICCGNTILFTLFGLAFLFPFKEVIQYEHGFSGVLTVFPFLLAAYLVLYPIAYYVLARKNQWKESVDSEVSYLDEREKNIVAESTKIAYKTLIGGLLVIISLLGGVKIFSLFTHIEVSIYSLSIALLTVLLDIAIILYCIKWCVNYKK